MSVELSSQITIRASAADVWAALVDFGSYGEWSNFTSIRGTAVEGASIKIRMPGMSFSPTLTSVVPERELQWAAQVLTPRLFRGEHSFRLAPQADGSTVLTNTEVFIGLTVAPFKRLLERSTRDNGYDGFNRALQAYVEHGPGRPTSR